MVGSGSSVVLCVSSGHWPMATVASCTVVGVLLDVGLASRKAKMFWTSERVNWREEATGVGARKRSTAAIHAIEGGTGTRAGTCTGHGAAETFVCTGTGTGTHVSARVGACAGRCTGTGTGVRVSERVGASAGRCRGA